jgi:hypothetical protein
VVGTWHGSQEVTRRHRYLELLLYLHGAVTWRIVTLRRLEASWYCISSHFCHYSVFIIRPWSICGLVDEWTARQSTCVGKVYILLVHGWLNRRPTRTKHMLSKRQDIFSSDMVGCKPQYGGLHPIRREQCIFISDVQQKLVETLFTGPFAGPGMHARSHALVWQGKK